MWTLIRQTNNNKPLTWNENHNWINIIIEDDVLMNLDKA